MLKEEEASGIWGQRVPVFIKLVHFSSFNSSYGIEAGNTLIYQIAQVLRACFPMRRQPIWGPTIS